MAPGSGGAMPQRRDAFLAFSGAVDGGELDCIVVWRLDRWGRSLLDLIGTLDELTHLGVGFVSLTEALDMTTPSGRALAGMLPVFAAFERDILRDRVRAGIAAARKAAKAHGRPITIQKYLPEIRRLHAAGNSKREIAKRLKITRTSVKDCWKHPERAVDRRWLVPGRLREWRPTSQILWDFTYLCWKLTYRGKIASAESGNP